jgi:hypothetical protein
MTPSMYRLSGGWRRDVPDLTEAHGVEWLIPSQAA